MGNLTSQAPLLAGTTAVYLLMAVVILLWSEYRRAIVPWLWGWLILSTLWTAGLSVTTPSWQEQVAWHGVYLLAFAFGMLSLVFLQVPWDWRWWGAGLGWWGLLWLLDVVWPAGWRWAVGLGWLVWWGVTAVFIHRAYLLTGRRPLHRNRLRYWVLALTLLGVAHLFVFLQAAWLSALLHPLAVSLVSYAVLRYRLMDMRSILWRAISLLLTVLISGGVYLVGLVWFWGNGRFLFFIHPAVASVGLTMMLLLFFLPLQTALHQLLSHLTTADATYDPNRTLSEYSATISHIVDLGQLEATVVSLISQAMEISYGTLFLVDTDTDLVGRSVYQLISVQGFGAEKLVLGTFAANSPVADYLATVHRPLTQYDIDLQPRFQETADTEKEWLLGLGMEVYVPIYIRKQWSGLLGLGPKMSGNRYYDRDVLLLSTLADQTAVALENARLVGDLVRLNHDLQQAYDALEVANRQLQSSHQIKSDFISAITHELLTPFAQIDFALQLLRQQAMLPRGVENLYPAQWEEMTQLTHGVRGARVMIENLVKFAAFINKQGDLRLSRFDFRQLLLETIRPLHPLAENKNIALTINGRHSSLPLLGDRQRLADAIHHLVHNAIKFTATGGHIHISAWQDADQIHFEVQDNGRGIPADKLDILWDGFTQLADPVRRGVEGIGIGLALVKTIANAHQGQVYVHSQEQIGSTFGFTIPTTP